MGDKWLADSSQLTRDAWNRDSKGAAANTKKYTPSAMPERTSASTVITPPIKMQGKPSAGGNGAITGTTPLTKRAASRGKSK